MTAFKCPKCQNYFDPFQFTPDEMKEGPRCPICSVRLERIPEDDLGGKPDTEGASGGNVDIVDID